MTAADRLKNIESQYTLLVRGQLSVLTCPYCGGSTKEGESFCCSDMLRAIEAVLQRDEIQSQIDVAEKIAANSSPVSSWEDVQKALR